jgi:hypothetical protein
MKLDNKTWVLLMEKGWIYLLSILHWEFEPCQYWRPESMIIKTVSFTQKWQYSEKDKTWRVSDSGFEAFPSNSY